MLEDMARKRVQVIKNSCPFLQVIFADRDPVTKRVFMLNEHVEGLQLLGMSNVSESETIELVEQGPNGNLPL